MSLSWQRTEKIKAYITSIILFEINAESPNIASVKKAAIVKPRVDSRIYSMMIFVIALTCFLLIFHHPFKYKGMVNIARIASNIVYMLVFPTLDKGRQIYDDMNKVVRIDMSV